MLIHGFKDTAVLIDSSRALRARSQDAKVETTLPIPDMGYSISILALSRHLVDCLTRPQIVVCHLS